MATPQFSSEILDYIVDFLWDEFHALQNCSLVAKWWVPRARKHLFADVEFDSPEDLRSWKTTFPDPSSSPAWHTHALSIRCSDDFTVADAAEGGWIQTFFRVEYLRLEIGPMTHKPVSFVPFHRFSSTLRSLQVKASTLPCSQLFDLVYSFPLLEDLTIVCLELSSGSDNVPHVPQAVVPSISPPFTGSLEIIFVKGDIPTRRLLDPPDGVHFWKLTLSWCHKEDLQLLSELVGACSNTLESLTVMCLPSNGLASTPLDLSGALKLQRVVFQSGSLNVGWISAALRTITPKNQDLEEVLVFVTDANIFGVGLFAGETVREWLDLDTILVHVWESHSVRPRVAWGMEEREVPGMKEGIGRLLPEATKRRILDRDD